MSFHATALVHRCVAGCGVQVSRRGCRCSACHGAHVGQLRTPEDRRRIAQLASAAAATARTARAAMPFHWSAQSRFL